MKPNDEPEAQECYAEVIEKDRENPLMDYDATGTVAENAACFLTQQNSAMGITARYTAEWTLFPIK